MRLKSLYLTPIALLCLSAAAHASDVTYYVSGGELSPSGTFSGSFLIDSSSEVIDGGAFTVTAPISGTTYSFSSSVPTSAPTGGLEIFTDSLGDTFRLALNGAVTALNFNTAENTSTDTALILATGAQYDFVGGAISLTPPSPTPEPSSLVLFGTGLLGFAGVIRRRLVA